jgi:hypothetical protein
MDPTFASGSRDATRRTKNDDFPFKLSPRDLPEPCDPKMELKSAYDHPELAQIKEKFMSSDRIASIIKNAFGDQTTPAPLYQNQEETLTDIQRLIMLEDFDGLRKRVL